MKKSALVVAVLAGLTTLSAAFTKSDPGYKNLKVLPKNITERQMDSIMHHFNTSLGVRCNYCHVRSAETGRTDFASDSNGHKGAAREMIIMTNTINKNYFEFNGPIDINSKLLVTCYTCHHGKTDPPTVPAVALSPQAPWEAKPLNQ